MTDETVPAVPDRFVYDDRSGAYRTACSPEQSLSTAILIAIATLEDEPVEALPKLGDVVDPDALEPLFSAREDGTPREDGCVEFVFEEYYVALYADREIALRRR